MGRNFARLALASSFLVLASCGGGDSESGGGGSGGGNGGVSIITNGAISAPEDNLPPVTLSANVSGASFSISGGADRTLFSQSGNTFQFAVPISFETPLDANGDNVYEVEIQASANGQTDRQLFRITITDTKEGIVTRRVASGLGNLVAADQQGFEKVVFARANSSLGIYDYANNTIQELGTPAGLGTGMEAILAIGAIDTGEEFKYLIALDRNAGETVLLWYRDGLNAPAIEVDNPVFDDPGNIWISIKGSLVAYGDNGSKDAAWDISDPFGNIRFFRSGSATFEYIANGLRRPVLSSTFNIDQGEKFDELNDSGSWNFGWGQFDGFEATGWTPPDDQAPLFPEVAIARGDNDLESGGLVGVTTSIYVATDQSDQVFFDSTGRVFTWSRVYADAWGNDGIERRDADFAPDAGSISQPLFVGLLDDEAVGGTLEFPVIVDRDGEIFIVE